MLQRVLLSFAVLALVAGPAQAARIDDADQGGRPLTASMTGAAERPNPGDPDGTGEALITVNLGQSEVCFELTVRDIAPAAAAHIHKAGPDAPGPVVVGLDAPTDGSSSGCRTVDAALAKALLHNPEDYYVNVHNADYPPGAVRGQLSK